MSFLKTRDLLDSVSKDGKSGVVGGVRSLEKGKFWNHKDNYMKACDHSYRICIKGITNRIIEQYKN